MASTILDTTARALVAPGKGILAADESHATIGRRFEQYGIASSPENRRRYREMLFSTKGIGEFISGVILFDESLRQAADDGRPFVEGAGAREYTLVLMDGGHSLDRCFEVTDATLHAVFDARWEQRVVLERLVLKPNMVLPGTGCPVQASVEEVAEATVRCLRRTVPAAVPGIVFLARCNSAARSGAYTPELERSAA